jgi:hypothetical protein
LISTAAGGVLVMKVKLRSSKTVISTGMMVPESCWVWALNAVLAQRRADRRGRVRSPRGDLQLDECHYFLSHGPSFR